MGHPDSVILVQLECVGSFDPTQYGVGLYFTPFNPGCEGVSRSITSNYALITPFLRRDHRKVAPLLSRIYLFDSNVAPSFHLLTVGQTCLAWRSTVAPTAMPQTQETTLIPRSIRTGPPQPHSNAADANALAKAAPRPRGCCRTIVGPRLLPLKRVKGALRGTLQPAC